MTPRAQEIPTQSSGKLLAFPHAIAWGILKDEKGKRQEQRLPRQAPGKVARQVAVRALIRYSPRILTKLPITPFLASEVLTVLGLLPHCRPHVQNLGVG